ncbi:hypothetical protein [Xanthovirga aplysinae]|uniref:hypothetical protein n=1 Tax=Xanthovirga aplysinae TaxID=2529853 RepID=UPI0012BCD7F7|nr:hypothetical protein [Xanthovirga aplysinae]MTI29626.1 hypothetical protein [Xanthovirga aplysinae]
MAYKSGADLEKMKEVDGNYMLSTIKPFRKGESSALVDLMQREGPVWQGVENRLEEPSHFHKITQSLGEKIFGKNED